MIKDKLAQKSIELPGSLEGIGKLGLEGRPTTEAPGLFNRVISSAIGVMTIIAAVWFVFQFFTGAIGIITAQGDKAKIESARQRLVTAIIGIGIVVAAIFVIDFIGNILGLNILNPAEFIRSF